MSKLHRVFFLKPYRSYQPQDTAGFEEVIAYDLIEKGLARSLEEKKPEPPPEPVAVIDPLQEILAEHGKVTVVWVSSGGKKYEDVVESDNPMDLREELERVIDKNEARTTSAGRRIKPKDYEIKLPE